MTMTSTPVTIAGITLSPPDLYDADIDTANEVELVSRLPDLGEADSVREMQRLTDYLHSLDKGLVVDRYVTLLVKMAERRPGGEAADI